MYTSWPNIWTVLSLRIGPTRPGQRSRMGFRIFRSSVPLVLPNRTSSPSPRLAIRRLGMVTAISR